MRIRYRHLLFVLTGILGLPGCSPCCGPIPFAGDAEFILSPDGTFVNMADQDTHLAWSQFLSDDMLCQIVNSIANEQIPAEYFRRFRDEADFLVIVSPKSEGGFGGGAYSPLRNSIAGIGDPDLNDPSLKGSSGRLGGILKLFDRDQLTFKTALHELTHRWGNYLDGDMALAAFRGHWGYSDVHGPLGGWLPGTLQELGEGLHKVGNEDQPSAAPAGYAISTFSYAPLELYLMGLIPASEVPPVTIAVGAENVSSEDDGQVFRAQEIRTVTIDQIIAANGPRVPGFGEAQTEWTIAFMVLSPTPLSEADIEHFQKAIDFFTRPEDITLLDVFESLEQITDQPGLQSFVLEKGGPESFLNFFRATGGRGRLRLLKAIDLQR